MARLNSDDVHHAQILVAYDVTVENEVANVISTEIDTERDARKWVAGILVPERNLDHVEVLTGDSGRLSGPVQLEIIVGLSPMIFRWSICSFCCRAQPRKSRRWKH